MRVPLYTPTLFSEAPSVFPYSSKQKQPPLSNAVDSSS